GQHDGGDRSGANAVMMTEPGRHLVGRLVELLVRIAPTRGRDNRGAVAESGTCFSYDVREQPSPSLPLDRPNSSADPPISILRRVSVREVIASPGVGVVAPADAATVRTFE